MLGKDFLRVRRQSQKERLQNLQLVDGKCLCSALESTRRYLNLAQNLETMETAQKAMELNVFFLPTRAYYIENFPQNRTKNVHRFDKCPSDSWSGKNLNEIVHLSTSLKAELGF